GLERDAIDAEGQLVGEKLPAVLVDMVAQPSEESREAALGHLRLDFGVGVACRRKDLACQDARKSVGRKVTEGAYGPVHILHYAVAVVGWSDAKVFSHPGFPRFREVSHRQRAFHQRQFQVEPYDDMEIVGDLVRLDTEQAGLDAVDGPIE